MKVGDKVLIVDNLIELENNDIVFDMLEYVGKTATITHTYSENTKFELDIDKGAWTWYSNLIIKIE